MRTLTDLANLELRHDGLAVKVDLVTSEGRITLEIPVAFFTTIIATLANAAKEAWVDQGQAAQETLGGRAGNAAEIYSTQMLLTNSSRGEPSFMFRVGAADLVFPFDPQKLDEASETLKAALQSIAAIDRARRKGRGQ